MRRSRRQWLAALIAAALPLLIVGAAAIVLRREWRQVNLDRALIDAIKLHRPYLALDLVRAGASPNTTDDSAPEPTVTWLLPRPLACTGKVDCDGTLRCNVDCTGEGSCAQSAQCGNALQTCDITCNGQGSCKGDVACAAETCTLLCDKDSCNGNVSCGDANGDTTTCTATC